MNAALAALVPVAFFGLMGLSALYVETRLRMQFAMPSKTSSRVLIATVVFGALISIGAGATSATQAVGAAYLIGGYLFASYLYLMITLTGLHLLRLIWMPPAALSKALTLSLPIVLTVYGATQADVLVVNETRIQM